MMLDVTSPKLLVPTALFVLLSPGLLLKLPSTNIASMTTDKLAVFIHALVLVLVYWSLTKFKVLPYTITKADLLVPALLFVLLSPTILPIFKKTGISEILMSSLVFIILFAILRKVFPQYY